MPPLSLPTLGQFTSSAASALAAQKREAASIKRARRHWKNRLICEISATGQQAAVSPEIVGMQEICSAMKGEACLAPTIYL